jgi:hypothetical protein
MVASALVRNTVNPLNGDHIAVDHVQNPVAVYSQPVIPASVESRGGERVFGQVGNCGADHAHAVLVVHKAAG